MENQEAGGGVLGAQIPDHVRQQGGTASQRVQSRPSQAYAKIHRDLAASHGGANLDWFSDGI